MGNPVLLSIDSKNRVIAFVEEIWEKIPPNLEKVASEQAKTQFLETLLSRGLDIILSQGGGLTLSWKALIVGIYWKFLSLKCNTFMGLEHFKNTTLEKFALQHFSYINDGIMAASWLFREDRCTLSNRVIAMTRRLIKETPELMGTIPEIFITAAIRFIQSNDHLTTHSSADGMAAALIRLLFLESTGGIMLSYSKLGVMSGCDPSSIKRKWIELYKIIRATKKGPLDYLTPEELAESRYISGHSIHKTQELLTEHEKVRIKVTEMTREKYRMTLEPLKELGKQAEFAIIQVINLNREKLVGFSISADAAKKDLKNPKLIASITELQTALGTLITDAQVDNLKAKCDAYYVVLKEIVSQMEAKMDEAIKDEMRKLGFPE